MSIYDKIKQLCKEKSVTVTGTEKELGFSRGSLCKIDKNKPSSEKLQKLADYFGVQISCFINIPEISLKDVPTDVLLAEIKRRCGGEDE